MRIRCHEKSMWATFSKENSHSILIFAGAFIKDRSSYVPEFIRHFCGKGLYLCGVTVSKKNKIHILYKIDNRIDVARVNM